MVDETERTEILGHINDMLANLKGAEDADEEVLNFLTDVRLILNSYLDNIKTVKTNGIFALLSALSVIVGYGPDDIIRLTNILREYLLMRNDIIKAEQVLQKAYEDKIFSGITITQ